MVEAVLTMNSNYMFSFPFTPFLGASLTLQIANHPLEYGGVRGEDDPVAPEAVEAVGRVSTCQVKSCLDVLPLVVVALQVTAT